MKQRTGWIRLIACLLLVSLMSACTERKKPEENESLTVEQTTFLPDAYLKISGGTYTLIRPERTTDNVVNIFKEMLKTLTELQGSRFAYGDDFVATGSALQDDLPEILIGKTNRSASSSVLSELSEREWRICTVGNQIVLSGADDIALYQAAQCFQEQVLQRADGLYVKKDLDIRGSYTVRDNSSLIPAILPDSPTGTLSASSDGDTFSPDWIEDLIIVEANLANATAEGTLLSARRIIDHLAEMGVNGLWITPIGDRSDPQYFYGNLGLHTIDANLTGTSDYDAGWQIFTDFVAYAHSRNIRIFMDVVTWGTSASSSLYTEHPDWYTGNNIWSGKEFNWNNTGLQEWFASTCAGLILRTGVDGLRCDCEPGTAGYSLFRDIRSRVNRAGKQIVIFSEHSNTRDGAFDFEQFGVFNYRTTSFSEQQDRKNNWFLDNSMIAAIRQSKMIGENIEEIRNQTAYYRFFTYCVSCHDFNGTAVNGDLLTLAYQALFSPFIPVWYLGEEFGWQSSANLLYDKVDWSDGESPEHFLFCETVKQMIAIRRTYPDLFASFAENHRESNICAVQASGFGETAAYARFAGTHGILVVPNTAGEDREGRVTVPWSSMKLDAGISYDITDLLTGEVIASGKGSDLTATVVRIEAGKLGIYLVEPHT